jgi:plastocyanin
VIQGQAGGCTPLSINIPMGQTAKITLKSNSTNMFLLTSKGLGINLMSAAGGNASQTIKTDSMGTFEFQCGIHGGTPVVGHITITM